MWYFISIKKYRTKKANALWLVIHNKIKYVQQSMAASGREFISTEIRNRIRKKPEGDHFVRKYSALCVSSMWGHLSSRAVLAASLLQPICPPNPLQTPEPGLTSLPY